VRYLFLILFVLIGGLLAVVVASNASLIHIAVFSWQLPELSVGVVIAGAVLGGAIFVYLVAAIAALPDWHELRQLRGRVKELEGQVATLRQQEASKQAPLMQMPGLGLPSRTSGPLPQSGQQQNSGPLPNPGK
jgi:uncharacterized integral membrane protein